MSDSVVIPLIQTNGFFTERLFMALKIVISCLEDYYKLLVPDPPLLEEVGRYLFIAKYGAERIKFTYLNPYENKFLYFCRTWWWAWYLDCCQGCSTIQCRCTSLVGCSRPSPKIAVLWHWQQCALLRLQTIRANLAAGMMMQTSYSVLGILDGSVSMSITFIPYSAIRSKSRKADAWMSPKERKY